MITIKELYRNYEASLDQDIEVVGWIRTVRSSKDCSFIELNDGTFLKNLQIVFTPDLSNYEEIKKAIIGSALEIKGILIKSPAAGQPFELKAKEIVLAGESALDYPLQKKGHSFEYLRTIAHLRPRSNTFSAIFRMRSVLSFAVHKFFQERGFVYTQTPIITTSDCEGAGEMFNVTTLDIKNPPLTESQEVDYGADFFGKKAGLTVSGQLNGEAFAMAFQKIYTFGPTFRAENSNTTRHAAEFWMVEPEIAFADLKDDIQLAEDMLKYLIKYALENLPEEIEFFNKFIDTTLKDRLEALVKSDFKRLTYTEAVEILEKSGKEFTFPVSWGVDLQTEHERYLTEEVFKAPVFLTDYPKDIKAFYMRLNDDNKTVAATDLLVPGIGEIIGGSQREDRLEVLEFRMKSAGLNPADYDWYLDLRKYGGVRHAGFGLGFERLLMYVSGLSNIRDVIPFPRTPGNASF